VCILAIDCIVYIRFCYWYNSGVTLTGGSESTRNNAVSATNIIENYHPITPRDHGLLFRCVSGLGPAMVIEILNLENCI